MLLSLSQSCFPSIVRALSFGPSFQITSKRLFILSITPSQNIYRRASQCNTVVPLVTTDFPFLWVAKTWINNSDVVINQETLRTSAHWSFSESQRLMGTWLKLNTSITSTLRKNELTGYRLRLGFTEWYRPFLYAPFVELFTIFWWDNNSI